MDILTCHQAIPEFVEAKFSVKNNNQYDYSLFVIIFLTDESDNILNFAERLVKVNAGQTNYSRESVLVIII